MALVLFLEGGREVMIWIVFRLKIKTIYLKSPHLYLFHKKHINSVFPWYQYGSQKWLTPVCVPCSILGVIGYYRGSLVLTAYIKLEWETTTFHWIKSRGKMFLCEAASRLLDFYFFWFFFWWSWLNGLALVLTAGSGHFFYFYFFARQR